jgi:DNA-directed RNA polymerase subunit H (RpoH/RPB5)
MVEIVRLSKEYKIYTNIPKLCSARDLKMKDYKNMEIKEFNNILRSSGLIKLEAERDRKVIHLYYIMPESDFNAKKNITNLITHNKADKYILIYAHDKKLNLDLHHLDIEIINGEKYLLRDYPEFFKKQGIKLRIVPENEINSFIYNFKIPSLDAFPRITVSDQLCIYSLVKKGDIVEILSPSITSGGIYGGYKLVV